MKRISIGILCICAFTFLAVKCHNDDDEMFCSFNYGQVVFTPGKTEQDQMAQPVFDGDKPKQGTYSAEPAGLVIDENTGEINIDQSTPAQEYTITFLSKNKKTRCQTSIYIEEPEVTPQTCVFKYPKEVYIPQEVADIKKDQIGVPVFGDGTEIDGTFSVEPPGLDIDPKTGIFSVNGSESGIKYTVTYISNDRVTSCNASLIISGIDYLDAIVDVSSPETSVVFPILDAQINSRPPIGFYDLDGSASQQNLVIDRETGAIDLRATLQQIDKTEFNGDGKEPAIPSSSFSRKYTIKYTFDRDDEPLISSLDVVIYWFLKEEDIPEDLRKLLEDKQRLPNNGRTLHPPPLLMGKGSYLK